MKATISGEEFGDNEYIYYSFRKICLAHFVLGYSFDIKIIKKEIQEFYKEKFDPKRYITKENDILEKCRENNITLEQLLDIIEDLYANNIEKFTT